MEVNDFWMPDYYPSFSCKMGACRHACCTGWPVSFSLNDYFRLVSEECSPALRDKLDRGIRVALDPKPDRCAEIVPRYDGDCPMRLADGRCAIHAELGENALSDVCRLYPRGIRKEADGYEISCSNSCEAVLELFLTRREPLRFLRKKLGIRLPPLQERSVFFAAAGHEREFRLSVIKTMQDRHLSIPERLAAIEKRFVSAEAAVHTGKEADLLRWLGEEGSVGCVLPEVAPKHLENGLQTAEQLIRLVDKRSVSIRTYGEEALAFFGSGDSAFDRYTEGRALFEALFPDWEIFFEHMLVNHMFFSCFPFEDRPEDLRTEFMALCAVYTLLRFLAIGCSDRFTRREEYTDPFAAAFRLIDHTSFDIYVSHLLSDIGWTTDNELLEWIIL